MALNTAVLGRKHPRFDSAAYTALGVLANSVIEIYEPVQDNDTWTEEHGHSPAPQKPIWRGYAVVTPNMDWRARDRRSAYDDTSVHAYRVQLEHIDKNFLVDGTHWGDKAYRVDIRYAMQVRLLEHNSDPTRVGLRLTVRNPTTDSDWWQPTLLCDIDLGDPYGVMH